MVFAGCGGNSQSTSSQDNQDAILPVSLDGTQNTQHTINNANFNRLALRLVRRFELIHRIPTVVSALNLLHERAPEHYAILSDVYGDSVEEHHLRYDHVSSLLDMLMRGAMADESWRNTLNALRFSEALEVLSQAVLLQKSVEETQGIHSSADFSEIHKDFESYLDEFSRIPIDLGRNTQYTINNANFNRLALRLVRRFELTHRIPTVVGALNLLHERAPEHYAILSDVYGDSVEEHHLRYDHVSSLLDMLMRGAMADESWRNTLNALRFSEALEVLSQAVLLQKSVEETQGIHSSADFSEIHKDFESYLDEFSRIPIDLGRVKLRLSNNSVSLYEKLTPRVLEPRELITMRAGAMGETVLHEYNEAIRQASENGTISEDDYREMGTLAKAANALPGRLNGEPQIELLGSDKVTAIWLYPVFSSSLVIRIATSWWGEVISGPYIGKKPVEE
ncbi:hypothetical protein DFQ28_003792 [Apophysomyces sp. BC1034]|nr:hypothetical protein DFQ28_003792 [Apophysomyces sp. BC1034]